MRISLSKVLISALLSTSILSAADISLNKVGYFGEIHYDAKSTDNYIYTATSSGMVILDRSNLAKPTFAGKYKTNEDVKAIALKNNTALLAVGKSGLHIVDVTDATNPAKIAILPGIGEIQDVVVNGDFAYAADDGKGVISYSLLDPTNVTKMGDIAISKAKALATSGNYLYAASDEGIKIIDISNPASLNVIGTINNTTAKDLFIKDSELYTANGKDGIKVYDISNPSSPTEITAKSKTEEIWNSKGVMIEDSLVFAANGPGGIAVLNEGDMAKRADLLLNGEAYKFNTLNREGFVGLSAGASGFDVIDYRTITDDNASNDALYVGAKYATVGMPEKTTVKGNHLYVADQNGGLQILDVTDPKNPSRIGGVNFGCKATSVAVNDDESKAYVTDVCMGLFTVDISDKNNPSVIEDSVTPMPNQAEARDVKIRGDYAYVAARKEGLQIFDISNPSNVVPVGSYDTPGKALALDIDGDYAYIADENETLQIINIHDPANPSLAGSYQSGYAHDVKVVDSKAYIANYTFGLQIVDVSDPANPKLLGKFDFDPNTSEDTASGIDVNGNYAYLAYNNLGVKVIDISTPANPTLVAQMPLEGMVRKITVNGDYIYASDQGKGIEVLSTQALGPKESFVSRLYRYMLNSTYDDEGLNYWVGELNKGKSALDIAEQFFFSDQFRDENLSDEDFIKRLYWTFLNRDPNEDMEGVNYWKSLIEDKGYSRLLVLYGIAFSDEFKQLAEDAGITPYNSQNKLKAFLERLYALVMTRPQDAYGKTYDQEGLEYWMQVLQSGEKTGGDVVKDFYNAPEFTSKNLSDPEFVKNAYYAIMGREPDAGGLNYWIAQLAQISRNDLLDQFIHSEEFQKYAQEYGIKPF